MGSRATTDSGGTVDEGEGLLGVLGDDEQPLDGRHLSLRLIDKREELDPRRGHER
jgi:hypothetical protein